MSRSLYKYLVIIIVVSGLNACQSVWKEPIPTGEIIYEGEYISQDPHYQLGFVDPSGENSQIIMPNRQFSKPVWSINGEFLYGLSDSNGTFYGYPAYWDIKKGKYGVCSKDLPYFSQIQGSGNPQNPYEVILQDTFSIRKMDLFHCVQEQMIINYESGSILIIGSSYSFIKSGLFYGLELHPTNAPEYRLMYYDLKSGVILQIENGINPTWSPDGSKVAFLGLDGLYIGNFTNEEFSSHKILDRQLFDPSAIGGASDLTPIPAWSPDGQWIIYHRCDSTYICDWEEAGIYKININNRQETLIIKGGEFPNWKP